ncbi:hypothetical protein Tco_0592698 [Tanacetum coccineum]
MNPRSCLRWKPTGRIFSNVRLRWIPTGKLFNSCMDKVDSEPTHVSIVDIPYIHASKQTLGLSVGISFNGQKQQRIDLNADARYNEKQENLRVWPRSSMFKRCLIATDQASVFMAMMSVHISLGLVLHQMTYDHNRSELGIQDHSNEQSSSKLIEILLEPASNKLLVGQTVVTATSIPFKCSIYKDDKDNDKGSKSRSQSMKEQAYNEDKDQEHSSLNDKSNLTDLMKECHQ